MVRAVERSSPRPDDAVDEVTANIELAADTGESYSLIVSRGVHSLICLHRNADCLRRGARRHGDPAANQTEGRYRSQWACAPGAWSSTRRDESRTRTRRWARHSPCGELGLAFHIASSLRIWSASRATHHLPRSPRGRRQRHQRAGGRQFSPSSTAAASRCRGLPDESDRSDRRSRPTPAGRVFFASGRAPPGGSASRCSAGETPHAGSLPPRRGAGDLRTPRRAPGHRPGGRAAARGRDQEREQEAPPPPRVQLAEPHPAEETVARLAAGGTDQPSDRRAAVRARGARSRRTSPTCSRSFGISSRTLLRAPRWRGRTRPESEPGAPSEPGDQLAGGCLDRVASTRGTGGATDPKVRSMHPSRLLPTFGPSQSRTPRALRWLPHSSSPPRRRGGVR